MGPPIPSPSSSIILISPTNTILLLSRLQTSSSFPSAHVFPGGNLETSDGGLPPSTSVSHHTDNPAYHVAAIRELFEESGILLARQSDLPDAPLLALSPDVRKQGRKAIHSHQTTLQTWLALQQPAAILDTHGLIPFSHWITPPNIKKRYTTQMYIYFLPTSPSTSTHQSQSQAESVDTIATSDGVETMNAEWATASSWIQKAQAGEVILFPPQFLLLHLISGFLDADGLHGSTQDLEKRRNRLREFIHVTPPVSSDDVQYPSWREKFISPLPIPSRRDDDRLVLGLNKPGLELKDSGLRGEWERVVLVKFAREGTREMEIRWRRDLIPEDQEGGPGKGYGVGVEGFTIDQDKDNATAKPSDIERERTSKI